MCTNSSDIKLQAAFRVNSSASSHPEFDTSSTHPTPHLLRTTFNTMKFTMMALFGAAASFANAAVTPKPLDVWVPKILTPNANTVWHHGEVCRCDYDRSSMLTVQQTQTVTWDTSDAPTLISNGFSIRLRFGGLISPRKR
jgi:hypothetical protein